MQIVISEKELAVIKDVAQTVIFPLAGLAFRAWAKRARLWLNNLITDNVNRIKTELTLHVDEKFKVHESTAFGRISKLEQSIQDLMEELKRQGKDK